MAGRHPKPTALLRFQKGKLYSDQRDRAALEPQPQRDIIPKCPRGFTAAERKAWRAYATVLENYGLLTAGNADTLERLATARALYSRHRLKYLEMQRRLDETPGFEEAANPYETKMLRVGKVVDSLVQELGLSSLGLAKLGSLALKARKEKEKFFND